MLCPLCKNELAAGDIVIDSARFTCIEGTFDGSWLGSAGHATYLFKSQNNPSIRQQLTHKSCLLQRMEGLIFQELTRGTNPFGGLI